MINLLPTFEGMNKKIKEERESLRKMQADGGVLESSQEQELAVFNHQLNTLDMALDILKKNKAEFLKVRNHLMSIKFRECLPAHNLIN